MTTAREQDPHRAVRGAVSASVALITRDVEAFDVPPSLLLEGTDAALVAEVLASLVSTLLGEVLADRGRQLLVRLGRIAAEAEPGGQGE